MTVVTRTLIGVAVASMVGASAHRVRALSTSGAIAAALMGTVAVAAGWTWAALLIAYFVASVALSQLGGGRKAERVAGIVSKVGPRDARQVVANGLPFLIAAIAAAFAGSSSILWMAIAAGSLAASAADTWATEIGTLVGQRPRSIVGGAPLAVGESGGITVAGTAAGVAGAVFVAATAATLDWPRELLLPVMAGGIAGSLADSIIGATIQRRSWCDACQQPTEMSVHRCGTASRGIGGIDWLDNDGVNLVATVIGAVVASSFVAGAP